MSITELENLAAGIKDMASIIGVLYGPVRTLRGDAGTEPDDEGQFRDIYRYRLNNIVGNAAIRVAKLIDRASGWQRFLALLKRMGIEVK